MKAMKVGVWDSPVGGGNYNVEHDKGGFTGA